LNQRILRLFFTALVDLNLITYGVAVTVVTEYYMY